MSNITVCARFRPLSSKERSNHGDSVCIHGIDNESFIFKDDKEENFKFGFDRVFYEKSEQAEVFEFLALPIVRDAFNGMNGTVITYGQTGAGKTFSMEGPSILACDEQKKGLLQRTVDELFDCMKSSDASVKFTIKLSMVEIYMEKVRDLFDLSRDNIQIKESRVQGILLSGVTEIYVFNSAEALQSLASGISNRAVGETQMNMASSRSHCIYIFTVQQELTKEKRVKAGKLLLVDLAGSEKAEKTGAEGKVLEEAKTINKSLSALGNVISALTCGSPGKAFHIPYRDSKLTRILQDALGGNSRTALLCCCSPSTSNSAESLSTLRFGTRAKHIKASPHAHCSKESNAKKHGVYEATKDESMERILNKLRERLDVENVNLLEELFIMEGIILDPNSVEDLDLAFEDVTLQTITSLQHMVEDLVRAVEELKSENKALKTRIAAAGKIDAFHKEAGENGYANTGELSAGLGFTLDPVYGRTHFKASSGRFCDGRLIVDFLMDAMKLPFLNAYLDSIGLPSFQKGCNFAAAGSTIHQATPTSVCPFSFDIQVNQFLHFKARVVELLAKGKRLDKYIPAVDYFSKGLYTFDIGQNDLAGAFYSKTIDQVLASIPKILEEFETGLRRLYDEGARNFWIHNTGPLGCLAQNVAKFGTDLSMLDELGCVSGHNQAAKLFNLQLHALCKKLQGDYTDSNITYVDIYTIKYSLIANYSRYGFEQPIMACCGVGGAPLNYNSGISCGQTKVINGTSVTAKACSDSTEYVNWDGIHYTEAANQYVSTQILTGKYSDPPFADKMPFLLDLKF
ncbi:kinesin-like protein KIN-1 [Citrus sinensis]|uniref:Kinesin-like protein KIN-1 n=1 Tax=Citrus sinensis TaxID=2711 RepID=A0ACB8KK12_CITSI|nr:kinesin-like protein KIN-1 [Citrus sinensis]